MKKLLFNHKKLLISFAINCCVLLVCVLMFFPTFKNEADIIMQSILYGVGGYDSSSAHLLFSNVLLGKVLKSLFAVCASLPWYALFHYCMVFISLWAICFFILNRSENTFGLVLSFLFALFFGYEGYVNPNYIITSIILVCAGCLLIIYFAITQKKCFCTIGVLLYLLASLVSFKIFVVGCVFGCICYVSFLTTEFFSHHTIEKSQIIRVLGAYFVIVFLGIMLMFVDRANYCDTTIRVRALRYRNVFEKAFSFGYEDYDYDAMLEMGIETEGEYIRLVRGIFVEGDEEDLNKMKSIVEKTKELDFYNINKYLKSVPIQFLDVGMTYLYFVLLILYILYSKKSKKYIVFSSTILLFLGTLLFYLYNLMNYSWIKAGCMMLVCIYVVMYMNKIEIEGEELRYLGLFIVIFLTILNSKFSTVFTKSVRTATPEDIMENLGDSQISILDLTHMLSDYSAFYVFPRDFCGQDNIYVANGVLSLADGFESAISIGELENCLDSGWENRIMNKDYLLFKTHDLLVPVYNKETKKVQITVKYLYPYDSAALYLWSTQDQNDLQVVELSIGNDATSVVEIDVSDFQLETKMQIELHTRYRDIDKILRKTQVTCR
ncbi:MAG: hypothetical protein IIX48_04835 [Lachnospiraceae bacterium]|nr:hypothetical protein [Lachnospiraceae bacterium]